MKHDEAYAGVDRLKELWGQIEHRLLNDYPRFVNAHVTIKRYSVPPPVNSLSTFLGFAKVGDKRRLCVGSEECVSTKIGRKVTKWRPISDCAIQMMVDAVPFVGELKKAMLVESENLLVRVDEAIGQLKSALGVV